MSEPVTWIGIAALAVSNMGMWIDKFMTHRRNGNGKAKPPCPEHHGRLVKLETEIKGIEVLRRENREDHQRIFDSLEERR